MRVSYVPAFLLALLIGFGCPAWADDCPPLTRVNSINMTPVPGGARMLVPVTINGAAKTLLLGTAGGMTTLNGAAAEALNMHLFDTEARLLDSSGNVSKRFVRIDTLQMGGMRAKSFTLMITPDRNAGAELPGDGVLAGDMLSRYDVEMDFSAGKLNYFSPDHCAGQVIYWKAGAVGVAPIAITSRTDNSRRKGGFTDTNPVSEGPVDAAGGGFIGGGGGANASNPWMNPTASNKPGIIGADIQIPVTLDGKLFTANIDTGLEHSTLNTDAAKAVFDVTAESPGSAPAGSLNTRPSATTGASETVTVNGARVFEHTFHILSFGGVTVSDPHFLIRPDLTGARDRENTLVAGTHTTVLDDNVEPDISIGMDVLRQLHLFFAFKEGRLYVTPKG